ncbi:NAD-dependent deacylase [bacterium]|nr:NAD-dependent deacylase [bacterium]
MGQEKQLSAESRAVIEALVPVAAKARRVFIFTGAGVSAESGIPTFRDAQTGLWAKYDPVMLASIDGFRKDPANVWKWYDERRQTMSQCVPNAGHTAITEWQRMLAPVQGRLDLATQNIDDLHRIAGTEQLIELHGNIWEVRPLGADFADAFRLMDCPLSEHPPRAADGSTLRQNVVWFGEMLDESVLNHAFHCAMKADLALSIGTSSLVYPAAALPFVAREHGATLVEVNPERTELTAAADYVLQEPSSLALPALVEGIRSILPGNPA